MSLREMLAVGRSSDDVSMATPPGAGFLFGGYSLALALVAAAETVEAPMVPKSLHAWFLRPGQWGSEMTFSVQRWSDGRSFSTRHVTLNQGGRAIGEMATSFHVPGEGGDWYASPSSRVAASEDLTPARVRLPEQLI